MSNNEIEKGFSNSHINWEITTYEKLPIKAYK